MIHVVVLIAVIIMAWRWGEWKNWSRYHATMLFMAAGDLFYKYLYHCNPLWEYGNLFINQTVTDLIYNLLVLPLSALLLLSNCPESLAKQAMKILKFMVVFALVEFGYQEAGLMQYHRGWNLGWSVAWDGMMFPMLILHYKKPVIAYLAGGVITILVLYLYPLQT
jgi:hypothetical protein